MTWISAIHWPVLAQDSDDLFRWAIILFFIVSSILSMIGNIIKKKRGKVDVQDDFEEDEDTVIILSDEVRPASPPPVARRARPSPPTAVDDAPPTVRPASPRPPRSRPAVEQPVPPRRPARPERPRPRRPQKRRVGTLVDHHGPIEHAKHITRHADQIGDRAEDVGTLDDRYTKPSRLRKTRQKGLDVSRQGLRQAIVLNEILGPPLALRNSDDAPGLS